VISFLIAAFILFMPIEAMNQLRRKQEEEPQSGRRPPAKCRFSRKFATPW
jgi:large-conductance mechanosensitive channel